MSSKQLINVLAEDLKLRALFSGIVLCGVSLLTIVVTAGVWYL